MNRSELLEKLARELDEWPTPTTCTRYPTPSCCEWLFSTYEHDMILATVVIGGKYERGSIITKQQWLDEKNRLEKIDNTRVILTRDEMLLKLAQNMVEWKDKGAFSDEKLYRWGWEWGVTMESPDLVIIRNGGSEIITESQWLTRNLDQSIRLLKKSALREVPAPLTVADTVNHPGHYTQGKVECIDAIESATVNKSGIEAVCTANVIKYLWRYESKNGVEDVKKARWYLERLIKELDDE